jgi:hypothetical protein
METGFYWVRVTWDHGLTYEPPEIARWDGEDWYVTGSEIPQFVKDEHVLSERLEWNS